VHYRETRTSMRGLDSMLVPERERLQMRKSEEDEKQEREQAAAAQEEMGLWVADLRPWDVFFTGTYAPKKRGGAGTYARVSRSKALADGRRLIAFTRRLRGRRCEGIVVAEPHEGGESDGSYHLHGLLEAPGVSNAELEAMAFYWSRHGHSRFDRPRSQEDSADYCAKYCTKDASHMYFTRGLLRPQPRGDS
jgi:hypothetical protein